MKKTIDLTVPVLIVSGLFMLGTIFLFAIDFHNIIENFFWFIHNIHNLQP